MNKLAYWDSQMAAMFMDVKGFVLLNDFYWPMAEIKFLSLNELAC